MECTVVIVCLHLFVSVPNVSFHVYAPGFFARFMESHAVMFQGNAGLKPKEGEVTSRPWQWPINYRVSIYRCNVFVCVAIHKTTAYVPHIPAVQIIYSIQIPKVIFFQNIYGSACNFFHPIFFFSIIIHLTKSKTSKKIESHTKWTEREKKIDKFLTFIFYFSFRFMQNRVNSSLAVLTAFTCLAILLSGGAI